MANSKARGTRAKALRRSYRTTGQQQRQSPHTRVPVLNAHRRTEHRRSQRFRGHESRCTGVAERMAQSNRNRQTTISDAARRFMRRSWSTEVSFCKCQQNDDCGDGCLNRSMRYECDDENCRVGNRCSNRAFSSYESSGADGIWCEKRDAKDKGAGLFATTSIPQGTLVTEYTGDVITKVECEARINTGHQNHYLMSLSSHLICDATNGGLARFINHSCAPNTEVQEWLVAGVPRLGVFASQRIKEGGELSLDYKFQPFVGNHLQPCLCGALSCRGFIGPVSSELL